MHKQKHKIRPRFEVRNMPAELVTKVEALGYKVLRGSLEPYDREHEVDADGIVWCTCQDCKERMPLIAFRDSGRGLRMSRCGRCLQAMTDARAAERRALRIKSGVKEICKQCGNQPWRIRPGKRCICGEHYQPEEMPTAWEYATSRGAVSPIADLSGAKDNGY